MCAKSHNNIMLIKGVSESVEMYNFSFAEVA